jgi:hypothetical protein
MVANTKVKLISYNATEREIFDYPKSEERELRLIDETVRNADKIDFVHFARNNMGDFVNPICNNALTDIDFFSRLAKNKFDFALTDGHPGYRCMYVLLYKLGIPYGTLATAFEPW